jgi:hypothetical protein
LNEIVPLLRCPAGGFKLRIESEQPIVSEDGSRRWPIMRDRLIFFGSLEDVREFPGIRSFSHCQALFIFS